MKWMLLYTVLALPIIMVSNQGYAHDLCNYARYEPNPSVAHKPEGQEPFFAGEVIDIPLTVDMAERYDIPITEGLELNAGLGMIQVNSKTGAMTYNGRDITGDIQGTCETYEVDTGYKEPDQEVKRIQGNIFKGQDITKQGKNIADF